MSSLDMYIPDPTLADEYIPRNVGGVLDTDLYENAIRRGRKATLLVGPTGSGKTEGIRAVCARLGIPMYIVQGSNGTTNEAFCGGPVVNTEKGSDRQFAPNPGPLVKMMLGHDAKHGYTGSSEYPFTVFVLDEINAIPSKTLLWLNSVNDRRRSLSLSEEQGTPVIMAHPGFAFFATMNEGHEYTGTKDLNPAVRNRFNTFAVGYSHEAENEILRGSDWLLKSRDRLRDAMEHGQIASTISTRALIDFANNVEDFTEAFGDEMALGLATEAFLNTCLEVDRPAISEVIQTCIGGGSGIKSHV